MQVVSYSCRLQVMLSSKIIFLSVLGVLAIVASTDAECCGCSFNKRCMDGTSCGFTSCCAYGSCNIFCCNCDGGCRTPGLEFEAKQNDNATHFEFLSIIDKDSSGDVDLQEFENFSMQMPQNMLVYTIFTLLDENEDGHISAKEFEMANLT